MGKHKKKYTPPTDHEPCPFCGSHEISVMIEVDDTEYRNMMIFCLDCRTRFTLDMPFAPDNVTRAYEIWDRRSINGKE